MAAWWRSHQEVQDAIESFGEKVQRGSEAKDLQKQRVEVESILKGHHNWLLHTLQEFKPPSATSKAALETERFQLGGQTIEVRADLKPLALTASEKLVLDETQAYVLVQRCVEEDQFTPTQAGSIDQVIAYYAAERSALLATLRTLLGFQDSDNSSKASPLGVLTDEGARLIDEGLGANLVGLVRANLFQKPPANLGASDVATWADRMAAEFSLLLSTLFMLYFNRPPLDSSRLLELGELFLDRIFLHDQSAADTWQSYTASDLSGVRHVAILVLLVLMGLDKLPIDGSDRLSSDHPLKTSAAVTHFNALVFHFGDFAPPLSLAWASSLQLLKGAAGSRGSNLLADLPPESGEYHIQRAEEGDAFEQMLKMLQGEEFRGSVAHVTAYKFVLKLVVSTTLRAYNLIPPVLDESNPRGDLVTDLLTALFSGEEYLALDFFDDVSIRALAEALALPWPARTRARLLRLMTSLCAGTWAAENVFNFLYLQRTICLVMPSSPENPKPSESPLPIPLAPGLFVPPGAAYAVLSGDVIDDVSETRVVAFECRQHPILLLLLTSQSLAKRLSRGSDEGIPQLAASLEFLAALVSAGGQTVVSLILDLEKSPLVIAGKRDGRVDPSLRIDAVTSVASICHYLANSRGKGNDLLPATISILAAFAELFPAKVAANVQQVVLFEVLDGKLERLQEILASGEYRTGGASLTLAVLDLVHRLVDNGVQSDWAAALVRFCVEEVLPQLRGRRYQTQALLWQVVARVLNVALAAATSTPFFPRSSSPVQASVIDTFLDSPSPEARNMLLSILAVGARGLESIEYSEELEAAQAALTRTLRVLTLLLAHDEPSDNALEALLFKEGNEAIVGAVASFLRYSGSANVQVAAIGALRALLIRSAQTGGELATSIVKPLGREEATRVQVALGEALEEGEGDSPGQIFAAAVELLVAASEGQPSFVAWVLLPATSDGEKIARNEISATSGGAKKVEGGKSVGLEALGRLVKKLPDLVASSPSHARTILSVLLSFFRSCGSEAAESALGNKEQLWSAPKETLRLASKSVGLASKKGQSASKANRSASESVGIDKQVAETERVIALVLSILSEQAWAVAKQRKAQSLLTQEGQTGSAKSEAAEIFGQWETVGERPSETVRWLCQSVAETRVFRDAVLASRAAVACMLASCPPRASVALGEALKRARATLEAHPAFQQLLRDRAYTSSREPASLILTDLAAHLTGLLSDRPIPSGPFFELATYTEELSVESLLMLPFSPLTSSESPLTSSYDVAAARSAVGSDAAESVREAIEAVQRWNEIEEQARAHSHCGRSFSTLLGIVSVMESPDDIWPPSELSASISHVSSALQSAAASASASHSAAATSSIAAEHASVLASLLLSLVHASPPQIRRDSTPLVVQTASIVLQSNNGLFSESSALKSVLQSTLLCFEAKEQTSTERNQEASIIQREDPATRETLSEAIPAFCMALNHAEEQATVRAILSQLLSTKLPVEFWETRVIQSLPFSETVRGLLATPTEHLGGLLSLLQGLVQRSGEVAQRLMDAGLVQALVSLSRSHTPPFPKGPFSLSWDQTHANPSPVWGSVISLLAALNHRLGAKPSFRDRLESALAVIGPSILQTLNPPTNGRPRVSRSSIRTALFAAQLLTSLSQPGLTLTTLLGPRFMQALDSAVVQLLSFIALEGSSREDSLEVSCVSESKEDKILAATSGKLSAESHSKGWLRITASSQSQKQAAQPQTPLLTLPLTPATTQPTLEGRTGASPMLLGPSAYTEALAGEVYKLAEVLIRYEAVRISEAVQQIQRHVTRGAPPPEVASSEVLHAIQDQCLSLLPGLLQFPSFADPLLALLDHAFLLDATTTRLFGANVSKLRTEIVTKHVKTALQALRKQAAASNEVIERVRDSASQVLPKGVLPA